MGLKIYCFEKRNIYMCIYIYIFFLGGGYPPFLLSLWRVKTLHQTLCTTLSSYSILGFKFGFKPRLTKRPRMGFQGLEELEDGFKNILFRKEEYIYVYIYIYFFFGGGVPPFPPFIMKGENTSSNTMYHPF